MARIILLKMTFYALIPIVFIFCFACAEENDSGDDDGGAGPGELGFLVTGEDKIYRFTAGGIEPTPIYDAEASGIQGDFRFFLIRQFRDIVYFFGSNAGQLKYLKYENGEFETITVIDDYGTSILISAAMMSKDNFLLLNYNIDSTGEGYEEIYFWYPMIGVNPVGLFSGFLGGAYPFDEKTIYAYQLSEGVKPFLKETPSGTLRLAAPLGDRYVAATSNRIFLWMETDWMIVASGTVDEMNTDLENDILFYRYEDSVFLTINADYRLVPYDVFDTSSCPYSGANLMAGDKKAFLCAEKPANMICSESFGTGTYLVIEENGNTTCYDTPAKSISHGDSFLFILWRNLPSPNDQEDHNSQAWNKNCAVRHKSDNSVRLALAKYFFRG